jgi:hypothetical protein
MGYLVIIQVLEQQDESVDIQIMLLPNLGQTQKEKAIRYLVDQVVTEEGRIAEETLFLSMAHLSFVNCSCLNNSHFVS